MSDCMHKNYEWLSSKVCSHCHLTPREIELEQERDRLREELRAFHHAESGTTVAEVFAHIALGSE